MARATTRLKTVAKAYLHLLRLGHAAAAAPPAAAWAAHPPPLAAGWNDPAYAPPPSESDRGHRRGEWDAGAAAGSASGRTPPGEVEAVKFWVGGYSVPLDWLVGQLAACLPHLAPAALPPPDTLEIQASW